MAAAVAEPVILVPDVKAPCAFCGRHSGVTELTLPWRKQNVGWWCCDRCVHNEGKRALYAVMDKRHIVGMSALPEWLMEYGIMNVCRSNGEITPMQLVSIDCSFSCNEGNVTSEGRVCLSREAEPKLFIDMMTVKDDDAPADVFFKQVPLQNLYENNPNLLNHGPLEMRLPPWVSEASRPLWTAAVNNAFTAASATVAAQKNAPALTPMTFEDEDPNSITDTEATETPTPGTPTQPEARPPEARPPTPPEARPPTPPEARPPTLPEARPPTPQLPAAASYSSGPPPTALTRRATLPTGVELHAPLPLAAASCSTSALTPPPRHATTRRATLLPGVELDAPVPPGVELDAPVPPGVELDVTVEPGIELDAPAASTARHIISTSDGPLGRGPFLSDPRPAVASAPPAAPPVAITPALCSATLPPGVDLDAPVPPASFPPVRPSLPACFF